jgi:hypothetical protein
MITRRNRCASPCCAAWAEKGIYCKWHAERYERQLKEIEEELRRRERL